MKRLTFNVSGMVLTTLVSKQLFGPGVVQTLQAAKGNSAAAVVIVAWVYYGERPLHCLCTAMLCCHGTCSMACPLAAHAGGTVCCNDCWLAAATTASLLQAVPACSVEDSGHRQRVV